MQNGQKFHIVFFQRHFRSCSEWTHESIDITGEIVVELKTIGIVEFSTTHLQLPKSRLFDTKNHRFRDFGGKYPIYDIQPGLGGKAVILCVENPHNRDELLNLFTDTPTKEGTVEEIQRYAVSDMQRRTAHSIWEK